MPSAIGSRASFPCGLGGASEMVPLSSDAGRPTFFSGGDHYLCLGQRSVRRWESLLVAIRRRGVNQEVQSHQKKKGSRNKRTLFQEALESHGLQAISQLKLLAFRPNPDMTALRLYVERLVAIPKPANSQFRLPRVRTAADLPEALSALTQAVSRGRLSAQEGEAVARIIEGQRTRLR